MYSWNKMVCRLRKGDFGMISISEKITITVQEASEYSNIGVNRLRDMLYAPGCPFAFYISETRALIKRQAFEEYINARESL